MNKSSIRMECIRETSWTNRPHYSGFFYLVMRDFKRLHSEWPMLHSSMSLRCTVAVDDGWGEGERRRRGEPTSWLTARALLNSSPPHFAIIKIQLNWWNCTPHDIDTDIYSSARKYFFSFIRKDFILSYSRDEIGKRKVLLCLICACEETSDFVCHSVTFHKIHFRNYLRDYDGFGIGYPKFLSVLFNVDSFCSATNRFRQYCFCSLWFNGREY